MTARCSRARMLGICTAVLLLAALPRAGAQRPATLGLIVAACPGQSQALPPWQAYADALGAELSASGGLAVALLYEGSALLRSRDVQFPSVGDPRHWRTLEPVLAELVRELQLDYLLLTCLWPPATGENAVATAHGLLVVRGDGACAIRFSVTQGADDPAALLAAAAEGMESRVASTIKSKLPPPSDLPEEEAVPVQTPTGGDQPVTGGEVQPATGTESETGGETPGATAYHAAVAAFERGDYEAASAALRKAFEEPEPAGEWYLLRARVSLAQHHPDAALEDLTKAVAAAPDLTEARMRLARMLQERGLWQDAVKHYQAALAVQPDNSEALMGLARAYRDNGHTRKAIELLEGARQSRPQDAAVLLALADLYAGADDPQLAEPLYLQAVALSPGEGAGPILERLGDLYVRLRRHRDALGCYVKAAALNPSRNAMVKRRYRDVMQAADDTVREELENTWRTLQDYVRDGVGEREQVYARLSVYDQHLEEAIRFADSVVPPTSLEIEHAQRQLTYSLAREATVAALAHLDLGGEDFLQQAEQRQKDALAEFSKLASEP